jgi:putative ABC transport system substrate-binding protein
MMMTQRRKWLLAIGSLAATAPFMSRAQSPGRISHIAYMSTGTQDSNGALLDALKESLRELGYVDGKNLVIDVGWVGPDASAFPQLAASMVKNSPGAIVGTCVPSTRAAKNATRTIPVVMSVDGDPVAAGLIASFAHPGGNVTGTSTLFESLIPKWIELLNVAVPKARDIAILSDPDNLVDSYYWARTQDAAQRIGVNVLQFGASKPSELEPAFADMKRKGADAVVVMTEAFLTSQLTRIVPLANRYNLPAIYGYREFAEAGGMMSYGVSYRDYYKRVARYIDQVLRGTKPADLPVEQPTRIELVVNQSAARTLGVTLPQSLLLRADAVIQ